MSYAFPPGGLPDQSVHPEGTAVFTESYAVLPAIIFVIAAVVVWRYPITKERQERIRAAIDRRTARRARAQAQSPDERPTPVPPAGQPTPQGSLGG